MEVNNEGRKNERSK